jgi:uncharacterized protein Smg (DUF494 family)
VKERVVEILVYLMAEIEGNKRLSDIDLLDLQDKGYSQSEISAAFSWLYDNLPIQDGRVVMQANSSRASRRLLHDAEKMIMTTEAHGYLLQLCELGLIEQRDLENVLERAMMAGFEKISIQEMREIVASALFAKPNNWKVSRSMLNNSETIH